MLTTLKINDAIEYDVSRDVWLMSRVQCVLQLVCCHHLSTASGLNCHLTVDEGGCVCVSVSGCLPVCIDSYYLVIMMN